MPSISNADIFLCRYNNYANREEKDVARIVSASDMSESEYGLRDFMSGIDFNPGDGVNTTLICNRSNDKAVDYVFVRQSDGDAMDSGWFIMRSDRLRNGQYRLSLKRDLISDFYQDIKDSPIYVQKATLKDDDPMIYNDEAVSYNQIKQSQTPLMDATNCGWIVGYVANDTSSQTGSHTVSVSYPHDMEVSGINTWSLYKYVGNTYAATLKKYFAIDGTSVASKNVSTDMRAVFNQDEYRNFLGGTDGDPTVFIAGNLAAEAHKLVKATPSLVSGFEEFYPDDGITDAAYALLKEYDSQVIYDKTNDKFYRFSLVYGDGSYYWYHKMNYLRAEEAAFLDRLKSENLITGGTVSDNTLWTMLMLYDVTPTLTEIPGATTTLSYTWPRSYTHLQDAPYSMFCMPCPVPGHTPNFVPPSLTEEADRYTFDMSNMTKEMSMSLATGIATNLGATAGFIIDLQYLPYCPIDEVRNSSVTGYAYENAFWGKDDEKFIDYVPVYWCVKSSFDLSIATQITVLDKKASHCCDKYRLMSPNFANYDDFDPAKNGGVTGFHVIATYKPYTPYICVHMNYAGLYGKDFDDNRGLTLGGDFSIPIMSDEWINYQIQNKNYANIFDRQLRYDEQMYKAERYLTMYDTLGSMASGSLGGASSGGPLGAIAGAFGGFYKGASELDRQTLSYEYGKSYKTDMYNYSLQNIQAKPDTLVKTSSINANNTTWPTIEYYTCTDEEKKAFQQKMEYNGMTVMRIGTLSEFMDSSDRQYFQGQLIQCDDFQGDANMFAALQDEIAKGFYIIGGQ